MLQLLLLACRAGLQPTACATSRRKVRKERGLAAAPVDKSAPKTFLVSMPWILISFLSGLSGKSAWRTTKGFLEAQEKKR